MASSDEFTDQDDLAARLKRQAWHEAQTEIHAEIWQSILRKSSDVSKKWRQCSLGICRRMHRCSGARLACMEAIRRQPNPVEMSADETAKAKHELKQLLQQVKARHAARGVVSDTPERIEALAERKLASLRASHGLT